MGIPVENFWRQFATAPGHPPPDLEWDIRRLAGHCEVGGFSWSRGVAVSPDWSAAAAFSASAILQDGLHSAIPVHID